MLYFYSSFTEEKANKLNLTGYVQNASDGTVVGEAQGDQSSLDKFVQHLNMGPKAADVNQVEQKEMATKVTLAMRYTRCCQKRLTKSNTGRREGL